MEKIEITFIFSNDHGKRIVETVLEDNLVNATRLILTYKTPKRYELDEIKIVKGYTLF